MKVPKNYKWKFQSLIQREHNETLRQIEQYGKGTCEQKEAIKYANFLSNILRRIDSKR